MSGGGTEHVCDIETTTFDDLAAGIRRFICRCGENERVELIEENP